MRLDHNLVLWRKPRFWKRCSTRSEESGGSHKLTMKNHTKHFVKNVCIDSASQGSLDSNSKLRHETVWNRVSQTSLLQDRLWHINAFQIPNNWKLVGLASSLSTKPPNLPQEVRRIRTPLSYHNPAQYENNPLKCYAMFTGHLNHLLGTSEARESALPTCLLSSLKDHGIGCKAWMVTSHGSLTNSDMDGVRNMDELHHQPWSMNDESKQT